MQTPVAVPVATPMPVAIAVPSGAPAAEGALAKLGNPTGSLAFELVRSRISATGGFVNQTITGDVPVLDAERREVARLAFESSDCKKHLRASLVLPSGEAIAELVMGTPPQGGARGMVASIGASYSHGPAPPVQLSVLGQAYAIYANGTYMNGMIQSGARWNRTDGTGGATVTVESPGNMCCCCIPNAMDQQFSRKKAPLGKKQVLMIAQFDGGGAVKGTSLHLITDPREGRMPKELPMTIMRRVVCELQGDDARKRLDAILMGAVLAALHATQGEGHSSHGGGG